MTPSVRVATSAASSAAGTSPAATISASAQVGDLMIIQVASRSGTSQTYTPPTDSHTYTSIRRDNSGASTGSSQLYWTTVLAGDPGATLTWSIGTSANWAMAIYIIQGANTTTPIDVQNGQANASSTSVTAPTVTTTNDNDLLLFFAATFAADTHSPPTSPGTFFEDYDVKSTAASSNLGIEGASLAFTPQGATGSVTATASPTAAANTGQLVAIFPTPATGGIPPRTTVVGADLPWFAEV